MSWSQPNANCLASWKYLYGLPAIITVNQLTLLLAHQASSLLVLLPGNGIFNLQFCPPVIPIFIERRDELSKLYIAYKSPFFAGICKMCLFSWKMITEIHLAVCLYKCVY